MPKIEPRWTRSDIACSPADWFSRLANLMVAGAGVFEIESRWIRLKWIQQPKDRISKINPHYKKITPTGYQPIEVNQERVFKKL